MIKKNPTVAEARRSFYRYVVISRSQVSDRYLCHSMYTTLKEAKRWSDGHSNKSYGTILRILLEKP